MKSRKLSCQICGTDVPIRSTIKTGENKGKKACPGCKTKADGSQISKGKSRLKPITSKRKKIRAEERKGLPEFFITSISELKEKPFCQNCGERINTSFEAHHNIAHILPKSRYKSVMTHPDNKLFLCASKDNRNACHEKFDSSLSAMMEMPVLETAVEKFQKFKDEVAENGKLFHILDEYKPAK